MMTGPMFDRMDGDHDGRISLAEAVAAADRHFALRPDRRMLRRDGNPRPMERPPG